MTPAQLDHLKLIDAHLAKLLGIAAKRTPGDYVKFDTYVGSKDNHHGIADFCYCGGAENEDNASYFASCAGNAEAGWRATRAAIATALDCESWDDTIKEIYLRQDAEAILESILAAFPLELIQKP